eukprot:CAMPEP_0181315888 /NCGR_PEP_ID=MMETSP1101-20121128/15608_1 /TAXON_ID=46948 /ORGANISM="Rhodomonas abbreviata, Strain Caron Lab Isolate" /LENGTH=406 /DNA_ID=CAMNT_0023423111 /DNA_START=39 /DNA_END=1259 /DNA_ORIENTATION=+
MPRRKVIVNGTEFANHGIRNRGEPTGPMKVADWSAKERDGDLPEKVDLRPYLTDVENQANSNSCCANAVAGAYEYICKRVAMETGDTPGDISRLFIYYVGRKHDQVTWNDNPQKKPKDEGMTLGGAISALQAKGSCLAEDWPFDLGVVNEKPPQECFEKATDFKISMAVKVPAEVEPMRECLAEGFPIVFGLKLTQNFFYPPPSGIVKTPDPDDPKSAEHGLHAMLIVGYSDRQKVFIVRNSWGTGWGDQGYAYLPYDYVCCDAFNFLGQYAIKGLTKCDFTPDEDDGSDLPDPSTVDTDGDGIPDIEEVEDDEEEQEDDDFNEDMFDQEAEAKRIFEMADTDGSGALAKRELRRCLKKFGIALRGRQFRALMKKYDDDGDGSFSFDEFFEIAKDLSMADDDSDGD